jgi:hypothetical protein
MRTWDLAHAALRLSVARLRLGRRPTPAILAAMRDRGRPGRQDATQAARVAWAVPRMATRLPWRADCLVQAMAAEAWLTGWGLSSDLFIGVRRDGPRGFAAHAWLRHTDLTVTGGDFSAYAPILTPETPLPRP